MVHASRGLIAGSSRILSKCKGISPVVSSHKPTKCNGSVLLSTDVRSRIDYSTSLTIDQPSAVSLPEILSKSKLPARPLGNDTIKRLPVTCPGCGALSQTNEPDEAGYYRSSRKAIKHYLRQSIRPIQDQAIKDSEEKNGQQKSDTISTDSDDGNVMDVEYSQIPMCDRCHDLVYNNKGRPIAHPTMAALAESIEESPFNRNHVYHVLDAADFPMSLIPRIHQTLQLAKPRSQNRRARTKFSTKPTLSFLITRADLLGRSKEVVDKLMPYFRDTLRTALGRQGTTMRLGNIHLVSSKRGWWTKEIKDDIWKRGGGNWLVGKVNVGKSHLFPVLFPKGSGERASVYAEVEKQRDSSDADSHTQNQMDSFLMEHSLLPPAQLEVPFPAMPVVSHLPGTTASPIRLPFGKHKGELIDLPGLDRGNLEEFVVPNHKLDLVMQARPNVEQHVMKPGQSLLLGGGLIRITPDLDLNDVNTTMLAYPFVSIDAHVTSTEKAIGAQQQTRESGIKSILSDGAGLSIQSGGIFSLNTDVTKSRAGPLLRAGVSISQLPFKVYSCDILVEGVGWIELVCQIRKPKRQEDFGAGTDQSLPQVNLAINEGASTHMKDPTFKPFYEQTVSDATNSQKSIENPRLPKVEVFSPNGRHVAQRKSLGAWMLWEEARQSHQASSAKSRPRRCMKGARNKGKG